MATKKKSKKAVEGAAVNGDTSVASAVATRPSITLEDLATKYLDHMEVSGKSQGTVFSYKLELITAMDEIGKETPLSEITPSLVLDFFASDRVTKTKTGVAKAKPTVDKTRRVLRLALLWAQESGLIEKAPLPEVAAPY